MLGLQRVGHDWVIEQQQHHISKYLLRAYYLPGTVSDDPIKNNF